MARGRGGRGGFYDPDLGAVAPLNVFDEGDVIGRGRGFSRNPGDVGAALAQQTGSISKGIGAGGSPYGYGVYGGGPDTLRGGAASSAGGPNISSFDPNAASSAGGPDIGYRRGGLVGYQGGGE